MKKDPHKEAHAQYKKLCMIVSKHDYNYYVLNQSSISDRAYDDLLQELRTLEAKFPELITPDSPTQRVSETLREGAIKFRHPVRMYSLDNTYNEKELADFHKRIVGNLPQDTQVNFVAEPKIDGASVEVIYREGKLAVASTRGDGSVGEVITENIRTIRSVPLMIPETRTLTLRGEAFIYQEDLKKVNKERIAEGEEPFANPRNAASGALRLLDPKTTAQRPLKIFFYDQVEDYNLDHEEKLYNLAKLGLPTHRLEKKCENLEEVFEYIENFSSLRKTLPFETDGVVIKVNEINLRESLGATSRFPRWAIAYKYAAEQANTRVQNISCDVGRTGTLTPVAWLEPVPLSGTTVSKASLHNLDYVTEKDIRIGDTVTIEKAGEIIPQVISVLKEKRPINAEIWRAPKTCPSCGEKVDREEGEAALKCTNTACTGKLKALVWYFTRRSAMDIDHLGKVLVEQLIDAKIITDLSDIFLLPIREEQIANLDRMGKKSAANLIASVEKAKTNRTFDKLITGLGIPLVGSVAAKTIAGEFEDLNRLLSVDPKTVQSQLEGIHGFGPKIAESVANYLKDAHHRQVLERLLENGVQTQKIEKALSQKNTNEGPLSGLSFCVTGTLSNPRSEIHKRIQSAGGEVHDSVKSGTTYLVAGQKVGKSKIEKAQKRGTKVISEDELTQMLKKP